jgi:hypothetical protein
MAKLYQFETGDTVKVKMLKRYKYLLTLPMARALIGNQFMGQVIERASHNGGKREVHYHVHFGDLQTGSRWQFSGDEIEAM